jgi:hypothetical protein
MHTIIIRHTGKGYHRESYAAVSECTFFNKYIPDTGHNNGYHAP